MIVICLALLNQGSLLSEISSNNILLTLGAKLEFGLSFDQHQDYVKHFDRIDTDRDGQHSTLEFVENGFYLNPQARRGIFRASDENGDGFVSKAEYVLNRALTDEAKSILLGMDDNQNGEISRSEFQVHTSSKLADSLSTDVFDEFDTNDNGSLIVPEFLRVWGAWARKDQKSAIARLDALREQELDIYWAEVSRSVNAGDFEGYAATCHAEGVLVSGTSDTSYPLTRALARWKQGFLDTKSGAMKASVEFRFSKRIGDATTAHELGIFRYEAVKDGASKVSLIHFEALLMKKTHGWQILMENQKSVALEEEWLALASEN